MLEVTKLRAGYGAINVLWDVSLSIGDGQLTTIIGPNGAGKTTLLRAIMGLVAATQGQITLDGRALNGMGFNATLRDFGRLGLLMLHNGKRGDADIVGAHWIEQATRMLPTGAPKGQGFPGYGYQVWQVDDEPGAYAAVGLAGQYIYVSPKTDTVIVKLSYYPPKSPPTTEAEVIAYFKAIAHTPAP